MFKKIILSSLFVLLCNFVKAQIALENTYNGSAQVANFSSMPQKIYYIDSANLYLYNMNHTLWKKIPVTFYSDYKLQYAWALSDNLFNSDNQVEFIAVYFSGTKYPRYKSEVVSESGSILKSLDSAYSSIVQFDESTNNYKIFTSTIMTSGTIKTSVYSLPGKLPCVVCGGKELGIKGSDIDAEIFVSEPMPNPANDKVEIYYRLPPLSFIGEILLYNNSGVLINSFLVDRNTEKISINTSQLVSGTYFYNMKVNNGISHSHKLTIVK